jgi:predicted ATPase
VYIRKIRLINFKRFKDAEIDLSSKITVLLGPNSSGKSSVIKAILALKQTASPANDGEPLAAQGEYVDLGIYKDYVLEHKVNENIELKLELSSDANRFGWLHSNRKTEAVSFSLRLGHDVVTKQARLLGVSYSVDKDSGIYFNIDRKKTRDAFLVTPSENAAKLIADRLFKSDRSEMKTQKIWKDGISTQIDGKYSFRPIEVGREKTPYSDYPILLVSEGVSSVLRAFDRDFYYVGPLRRSPARSYGRSGRLLAVGAAGEHTPSVLANLEARAGKERSPTAFHKTRIKELKKWVSLLFPSREVDAQSEEALVKLLISRSDGQKEAISDVGFGVSQILPILVQMAVMPDDATLLVEQPELHLHPSVQTKFAKVVAQACLSGRRFVMETHSEHFVRGLQLAISEAQLIADGENKISSDDIGFLYIPEAPELPHRMDTNKWGEFKEKWPSGFFDEAYKLAKQLLINKAVASDLINSSKESR